MGARDSKQAVRDELAGMSVSDRKDQERINSAIAHLDKSLALNWYGDAPADKKIFDEEKKAVEDLLKVKTVDVSGPIADIVEIDRGMAQDAIDDVTANGGDPKEIAKANEEMGKAQTELDNGKPDKAIEHYRKAWQHAVKALGIDMGDPDAA